MTDGASVDVADEQILARKIILGHKALMNHLGCSLQEAIHIYAARYEVLRVQRPEDFVCSGDEYWDGFYS
ncbi:hypothetical protein ACFW3D_21075 [Streptomyces sp. NPDC058864]